MTTVLELAAANLLSPVVLAFVLGAVAAFVKSDLEIPEPVYKGLSIYLLLAIGLKGGAELAATPFSRIAAPAAAAILLGVLIPPACYAVLRRAVRLPVADAAAVAAHFGSVSVVTFIAATDFARRQGIAAEGFLPAVVALMEAPGILVALALAAVFGQRKEPWWAAVRETFFGQSIVCLLGGLVIGVVIGAPGLAEVAPFFVAPFKGALVLFLLELGMVAASRARDLRTAGPRLVVFGLLAPPLLGAAGVLAGHLAGLSVGGAAVMGALAASASYIAAPAAVRVSLPDANPAYYLSVALGVVFPFNLTVGIPLYARFAEFLSRS